MNGACLWLFSFGIVMWELASLAIPYEEYLSATASQHLLVQRIIDEQLRPTIPAYALLLSLSLSL